MKNILSALLMFSVLSAGAQVRVTPGNNTQDFKVVKPQPVFTSFVTDNADYFVIKRTELFENINTLIIADKSGNITLSKDLKINPGSFNDNNHFNNLILVGNTLAAFVENHNKNDGKNSLAIKLIDNNGNISNDASPVGEMLFAKLNNPGTWYVSLTPDKKHVGIIGLAPHEKDLPEQFVSFFLDENLKQVKKGQFAVNGSSRKLLISNFLVSDKGDFYVIADELDKSYKYPVVYKNTIGSETVTTVPVSIADASQKSNNYICSINPAGDLIIAGYIEKKQSFSVGDTKIIGSWLFNSSKPSEVKTYILDKPITSLTARNIIYNGDTFYVVGEQYKAEKEDAPSGMQMLSAGALDNFKYEHNDIIVTGYSSADATKKFELPIGRNKWSSRNFDQDLMVSSGIINNKLTLVFNDIFNKYFNDDSYYYHYKLPVAITITNDGVMETPVTFANELNGKNAVNSLIPLFFSNYKGRMVILLHNEQGIKTETFQ